MELFRHIDNGQTDKQTNGLTELFLKSLSRLKSFMGGWYVAIIESAPGPDLLSLR